MAKSKPKHAKKASTKNAGPSKKTTVRTLRKSKKSIQGWITKNSSSSYKRNNLTLNQPEIVEFVHVLLETLSEAKRNNSSIFISMSQILDKVKQEFPFYTLKTTTFRNYLRTYEAALVKEIYG